MVLRDHDHEEDEELQPIYSWVNRQTMVTSSRYLARNTEDLGSKTYLQVLIDKTISDITT